MAEDNCVSCTILSKNRAKLSDLENYAKYDQSMNGNSVWSAHFYMTINWLIYWSKSIFEGINELEIDFRNNLKSWNWYIFGGAESRRFTETVISKVERLESRRCSGWKVEGGTVWDWKAEGSVYYSIFLIKSLTESQSSHFSVVVCSVIIMLSDSDGV